MKELWEIHPLGIKVSNYGNVIGKKGKIVSAKRNGYPIVVCNGKKHKIHRLVWDIFGDGRKYGNGYELNHIDGNKLNNNILNLELITHQENMRHAFSTGLRKTKFTIQDINEIRSSNEKNSYLSLKYRTSINYIYNIKSGRRWKFR